MTKHGSAWVFLLLVFTLTAPLWLLSRFLKVEGLPDNLPVTDAAATFVPMISAATLVYRENGRAGVKALIARTTDYTRIVRKRWYLPIILLMPCLYASTYVAMRVSAMPVPIEWKFPPNAILIFVAFFIAAAGEELGYTGYALEPLQQRWGALPAALVLGAIHAVWHYPSMIQLGQSAALMAWGTLFTIAVRVLMVWLYNNTGSVFATVLFHAIGNTGRSLFPGGRSTFEMGDAAIGYSIVVGAAVIVTIFWWPNLRTRQ